MGRAKEQDREGEVETGGTRLVNEAEEHHFMEQEAGQVRAYRGDRNLSSSPY